MEPKKTQTCHVCGKPQTVTDYCVTWSEKDGSQRHESWGSVFIRPDDLDALTGD